MKAKRFPTAAKVAADMQWGPRLHELAAAGLLVDETEFKSRLHWNAQALETLMSQEVV